MIRDRRLKITPAPLESQPASPILLRLTLHRWRIRVFGLHPMRRAARAIWRAEPLRHDSLATELASLAEYNRAVLLEMLIQHDAQTRAA